MIQPKNLQEVKQLIENEVGILLYFSTPTCNVCKALKPKLIHEFDKNFPLIKKIFVDSTILPEVASSYGVFSVPTILLFLDKKEFAREGRNISIDIFVQKVSRIYGLLVS